MKCNQRSILLSKKESVDQDNVSFNFSINSPLNNYVLSERGNRIALYLHDELANNIVVKKYEFSFLEQFPSLFSQYLLPPNGKNLYEIVNRNSSLLSEFASLFTEQHLEFVLVDNLQTFVLQKRDGAKAKQYPFFSIADTFRRYMFYIAAIESNTDSVIVLEEPEVHSFPPYTQQLAQRMIYSETNQFFVSTHSPYLLHTLIENLEIEDLNVFITYYEDYQSKVHVLTAADLRHILDFSTDVFFNLDKFIPNAHSVVA